MRFFWRMNAFDALERAAAEARERWPSYADYALLREQGRRRDALVELERFVGQLEGESWSERWAFVGWLYGNVVAGNADYGVLAPHPLVSRVLLPTLWETVRTATCRQPMAYVWLCQLPGEIAASGVDRDQLLRDGLRHFPDHPALKHTLAVVLLGGAEHAAHHLDESTYLGDPEIARGDLTEARGLAASNRPAMPELIAAIDRQLALLDAWAEWSEVGQSGAFPAWCRARGYDEPDSPVRIYYSTE